MTDRQKVRSTRITHVGNAKATPSRERSSTEVAKLFPLQGQWTEVEYLSLPETNHIVELSNGRLVMPDVPTDAHQYAVGELFSGMREAVREGQLGHIRVAPL